MFTTDHLGTKGLCAVASILVTALLVGISSGSAGSNPAGQRPERSHTVLQERVVRDCATPLITEDVTRLGFGSPGIQPLHSQRPSMG